MICPSLFIFFSFGAVLLLPGLSAEDFDTRRKIFMDNVLSNEDPGPGGAPIQAFKGVPIPQSSIDELLRDIDTNVVADFDITVLIRILFLDDTYEDQILANITHLPSGEPFPYWLQKGETTRVYWSENHHIMWMSAEWLLKERYDIQTTSPTLRERLIHFLKVKNQYGFYEFFSTLYLPFTLNALLNLVDFCRDNKIRNLAVKVARKLLKSQVLAIVNSEGVAYPAAARNSVDRYINPFGSSFHSIVWLLTGLGDEPTTIARTGARGGASLLTSSLNVTGIKWKSKMNEIVEIGHPLRQTNVVNQELRLREDRTLAQWSFGGYFHPFLIDDTISLFEEFELYDHQQFTGLQFAEFVPTALLTLTADVLKDLSRSSVLVYQRVAIYRDGPTSLMSVQNYFPGQLGYEQFPWAASVGRIAVWTQTGTDDDDLGPLGDRIRNTHLPYIKQVGNVALIMYNPDLLYRPLVGAIGIDNFDVKLHWPAAEFDETRTSRNGRWVLGRQGSAYIAVATHCGSTLCTDDMQTWAVVVGTDGTYGDFDGFANVIDRSIYKEARFPLNYFGFVRVGDTIIDNTWRVRP